MLTQSIELILFDIDGTLLWPRGAGRASTREAMLEVFSTCGGLDSHDFGGKTDWFTLNKARLHLRPYTHPTFDIAVAAQVSPAGPRVAGRFGTGLLSIGATTQGGFDVLGSHWSVMEERSAEFGTTVD